MQITGEVFFRIIATAKQQAIEDRRRHSELSDLAQIHIDLGREMMCEKLEQRLRWHFEREQIKEQHRAEARRRRVVRDYQKQTQRQLANGGPA